jgi:multiple sugar transport system permease protein
MAALVFYPLGLTIWGSLHHINPTHASAPFIGIRNYTDLFHDTGVTKSWINTFWYVVIAVSIEVGGGLLIALTLNSLKVGQGWLLAAVVLPWALPPVVNSIVWGWIYNPSYGLLNGMLYQLGLISHYHVWFNHRAMALFLIALVHAWRMLPLSAVILLAALKSVPRELYEAAQIDGTNALSSFRSVTLPLISGGLAIALTQATVFALNIFDEPYVLDGTSLSTRSTLVQVYLSAFQNLHFSYGMALSFLLMVAALAISIFYVLRIYREIQY